MSTVDTLLNTEEPIFATLIRGRIYILGNKVFEAEVSVKVTVEEKLWLEENALDVVSLEDEGEHQTRAKFSFSNSPVLLDSDEPVRTAPRPRARTRG